MRNCIPSKIYIMQGDGVVKVGRSANPAKRAKEISCSYPGGVTLRYETEMLENGSYVETTAQENLQRHRISREWFSCSAEEAIVAVEAALVRAKGRGVPGSFSMRMNADLLQELVELSGDKPVQHWVEDELREMMRVRELAGR